MQHLLRDNDEDRAKQRRHIHRAIEIYRTLLAGGVVERLDGARRDGRTSGSRSTCSPTSRSTSRSPRSRWPRSSCSDVDERDEPTRSTCISVIEATLDDPRRSSPQQQFLARGEAVAAMKAEGIEYEQRMDLLEEVT